MTDDDKKARRNRVRKIFIASVGNEEYFIETISAPRAMRFAVAQQGLIKVRPAVTADMAYIANAVANGAEIRKA
jgi:hypothetical protein